MNATILPRLDNVAAVTYINQKGGTTSTLLCQLAITVWTWCMSRNVTLTAEHLPGHLNTIADQESWSVRDRCDWMLNPSMFQRIREKLGPLEVDLFASCLTKPLLQLESRPRSSSNRCLYAGLVSTAVLCQPTLVPDPSLPHQGENTISLIMPLWKTQS